MYLDHSKTARSKLSHFKGVCISLMLFASSLTSTNREVLCGYAWYRLLFAHTDKCLFGGGKFNSSFVGVGWVLAV